MYHYITIIPLYFLSSFVTPMVLPATSQEKAEGEKWLLEEQTCSSLT